MYPQHIEQHGQVAFQADPSTVIALKKTRDSITDVLHKNMYRHVRIQTLDGRTFEGTIVYFDNGHVYLQAHYFHGQPRSFFNQSEQILTLVLFELLVIVLLS